MHVAPHDNQNKPIVDVDHTLVPLNYFNIVTLKKGETFDYAVPGYETCVVPATGTVDVDVDGAIYERIGLRTANVWDGEPEGVYVPTGAKVRITCKTNDAETFIAGAKYDRVLEPFDVRAADLDVVQYGSDDTKTHRKIKHILGAGYHHKVGRLLVSELYTVGRRRMVGLSKPQTRHPTGVRMASLSKRAMTRPTTFASGPTMARAYKCSSARITRRAKPFTSWTDPRSLSTRVITPVSCCRVTRCTISRSSAD